MESYVQAEVSYIRARDPSILNFDRRQLERARKKILFSLGKFDDDCMIVEEDSKEQEDINAIQVYLRIKNNSIPEGNTYNYHILGDTFMCKLDDTKPLNNRTKDEEISFKKFHFTKIFGPDARQPDIFDDIVKVRMLDFINGVSSCILTYGASGSGKTFTMVGTAEEPGVIPRALEYLFRTLSELPKIASIKPTPEGTVLKLDKKEQELELKARKDIIDAQKGTDRIQNVKIYSAMQSRLSSEPVGELETTESVSLGIWVSFAEIYNEEINDLLQLKQNHRSKNGIGVCNGNAYIKDLTYINVSSGIEAYQIFQYGLQKLKYAETHVNHHSSRSHSIFTIRIAQVLNDREGMYVSKFNFCDLAGAERTKQTMNIGDRLKESNNINKSLSVLGRCITAIKKSQKSSNSSQLIPFRESKLTLLFQKALSGFENLCMIVNINTSEKVLKESINVLNFSALTQEIIKKKDIQEIKSSKESKKLAIKNEIETLKMNLNMVEEAYEKFKATKDENFELERQRIENGIEEMLKDQDAEHERKMRAIEDQYEMLYEFKIKALKRDQEKKIEKRKKLKFDEEMKEEKLKQKEELKNKIAENKNRITEMKEHINNLKMEKDKYLQLIDEIDSKKPEETKDFQIWD